MIQNTRYSEYSVPWERPILYCFIQLQSLKYSQIQVVKYVLKLIRLNFYSDKEIGLYPSLKSFSL